MSVTVKNEVIEGYLAQECCVFVGLCDGNIF